MVVTNAEFIQGFIRLTDDAFKKGWHERNGGNLSYRIKPEEIEEIKSELKDTKDIYDENRRLRKELAEMKKENAFLKKQLIVPKRRGYRIRCLKYIMNIPEIQVIG